MTNDDLIRACGRYFRQTNLAQYLKNPVFRQIEKDEIIDEPCPICCCDLEFNADDDNDNNIVDLPYAENHHYMHRDCYNEIQEELEEEIKNEKRELLIHRKIANGISKDIAEKEAEKAIEELDKEIQEETLEGFMTFLAGKKRAPSNCS